jgi:energy-coupling factor transport system ATP-binding protein
MIVLNHLRFRYESSAEGTDQIRDVSLRVRPGEFVLLTGESGCGKTTLTRILNGLCPQFYPGEMTGAYLLDGRDTKGIPINEIGTIVGSVFQDPRSQFFTSNTTDEIVMGMENNALPREEMEERFWETVSQIGVESLLEKSLFPLSSGEKQRVAIASVCAMRPKVLVLDEPSANLDSDAIAHLGVLLARLKESGTTIILSEHRLHYVKDIFDRMILMEDGAIRKEYTTEQALALSSEQLHDLGLRLFEEPKISPGKRIPFNDRAFFQARQISLSFDGQRILDEVELCVEKGEILAITGSNGAGKSSLCRVLTGLYKQNVGQVFIGRSPAKSTRRTRSTFFVQQDSDYQLYAATTEDEFYVGSGSKDIAKDAVPSLLKEVGLNGLKDRHPLSLSGGQKQRLLLALAAASRKEIVVLDEPTSGLDGTNMRMTAELLVRLAAQGKCIILITHDLELISLTADSLLFLDKGKASYHRELVRVETKTVPE